MQKFDIGDIVKLKSGGPLMTVKGYAPIFNIGSVESESHSEVVCIFEKGGKIMKQTFQQDILVIANI